VSAVRPQRPGPRTGRPDAADWICVVVAVVVLTGFAGLLVTGRYLADGPVLFAVSKRHGLHEGDLFVAMGWVLGVLGALWPTLRRRRA
jgi:hypothetical protein